MLPVVGDINDYVEDWPEKIHVQNTSAFACDVRDCFRDCLSSHDGGVQVCLNVYDVSQSDGIHHINDLFASTESPLKFGGIFHVGVEIFNTEWKYGYIGFGTGVCCGIPKVDAQHRFKQQICLPKTYLSPSKIAQVIEGLQLEFWGRDYDLLDKNCCHFANELCQRLGCGSIPTWVQRGANICKTLRVAARSMSLGEFPMEWLASCNSESRVSNADNEQFPERRICLI